MRIEINGKEVDVEEDAKLSVINQWFSFEKYFYLKSPVTSSLSLPLTKRNRSVLKGNTIGGNGSERSRSTIAIYFWQSVKVFDGECYINNTGKEYSLSIFGGGKSIKELLGDSKLHNLPGTSRYFDTPLVDSLSDNDSLDVKICMLDNGRYPEKFSDDFRLIDFFISFKTKYLIEQIFTLEGYSTEWGFDTSEFEADYTAARYPMVHNYAAASIYKLKAASTETSTAWPVLTGSSDKYWLMPDPTILGDYEEPTPDSSKVTDFNTFEFESIHNTSSSPNLWTCRRETKVDISVHLLGSYAGAGDASGLGVYIAVKPRDNEDGTEKDAVIKYLLPLTIAGISFSLTPKDLNIDLIAGDRLYVYFVQDITLSPGTFTFTGIEITVKATEEEGGLSVNELENFLDTATLPNIKKIDYIKDICSNFDLFLDVDTNGKKVSIYPMKDAPLWSQTAVDISKYVDVSSLKITTKPVISQTQTFGYKGSNTGSVGTIDGRANPVGDPINISIIPDLTNTTSRLFKDVNMIDLVDKGSLKDSWDYVRFTKGLTVENTAINVDTDVGSLTVIPAKQFSCSNFVSSLGIYRITNYWHKVRQSSMNRYAKVEGLFNFPNGFQKTLKPNVIYTLNCTSNNKFISGYFLLPKVRFDESGKTKLELIILREIRTGTPPSPLAWRWNDDNFVQWNDEEPVHLNN